MSNNANRMLIVLAAAAWIVLMAVLIFFTWTADEDIIDRIGDFQEFLADNNDDAGKLIVTLGAAVAIVVGLLVIILEVSPEEEERELRVEQAGATTIVPASALRQRLEEAVRAIPDITAARARVATKDKGIQAAVDVTLLPAANVAAVTHEASRVVVDTIQTDLGLPVVGVPTVRIAFAESAGKGVKGTPAAEKQPEMAPPSQPDRTDEFFGSSPPPEEPPPPPVERTWAPQAPAEPERPTDRPEEPQP